MKKNILAKTEKKKKWLKSHLAAATKTEKGGPKKSYKKMLSVPLTTPAGKKSRGKSGVRSNLVVADHDNQTWFYS